MRSGFFPSGLAGPVLAVLLASASMAAPAADAPVEQVVGGIEAVVFVCLPIDAKTGKTGQEILQRAAAQRQLDLAAIRKTEPYRAVYNSEVNRLLSLPAKERLAACQNIW